MLQKILQYLKQHKVRVIIVALLIIVVSFFIYKKFSGTATETRYVLAAVEKGTIISSVSGSGQVSASNQVDLKAKASGDVTFVGVKTGQEVKAGTIISQLNAKDVYKALRDATANVESAQLALQKLQKPADALTQVQAENALAQAEEAKTQAEDDLKKAYEDGFNAVNSVFLDLPTVMNGLEDILYSNSFDAAQANLDWYANRGTTYSANDAAKVMAFRDNVSRTYSQAKTAYKINFDNYKATSRLSDPADLETLLSDTYETAKLISDAVKNANSLVDFVEVAVEKSDVKVVTPAAVAGHQSLLDDYTTKTDSLLLSLSSAKKAITDSKNNIIDADRAITEKKASLQKIVDGTDALDLKSAQLTLRQRQNALQDARDQYSDYVVRAPFDGTIAKLDVKKGDDISMGAEVATIITKQQMAEISLNEVDVAKIKVGQKATITFDAIEDLTISGTVAEIDLIGTVTQGVVTYDVKISFDVQDGRVKPGMSISAVIITDMKTDILSVPNSAIKTQNNISYVEMLDQPGASATGTTGVTSATAPRQQVVETGISNDSSTEIVSGLKEGDQIVVRTIAGTTQTSATQAPSLLQSLGGSRAGAAGGGAARALR